jgi:glutamyl-tRNA reductase
LNYQAAPIDVRERALVGKADLPAALKSVGSSVILSTCNRTEVYVEEGDRVAGDHAYRFFTSRLGPDAVSASWLYDLRGLAALRHLCAVAAGLDSMVLGESQILGQVREALVDAIAAGVAGPVLTRAIRAALRVGRRARHETFVGRHPVSVSRAAVELARSTLGSLAGRRVVVVGAGEMGELTAQALIDNGVGLFAVANRTVQRAQDLAARHGGFGVSMDELRSLLVDADIVIASTDSPHPIIHADDVRTAMTCRANRPLFLIDIAVPRNIDPAVRATPRVNLCDIDDLRARCEHNRDRRRDEIERVYAIVDQELSRLAAWWEAQNAVPTVVELRALADQARREELAEALGRLRHLDQDDQAVVEALTRAIVNKLLHQPTVALKAAAGAGQDEAIRLVREIFGLDRRGDREAGSAFPDR